jgi:hypothetical protein
MLAGTERDRLLGALSELRAELDAERGRSGGRRGKTIGSTTEPMSGGAYGGLLSEEEEGLVSAIGEALIKIASAASGAHPERSAALPSAIVGALGGAELVMRGEIMAGRAERLPQLLPGFTYLATLPYLGDEEALRVSRRTEELVGSVG